MKKINCLLLSVLMVFLLSACLKKVTFPAQSDASVPSTVSETPSMVEMPKIEMLTLYIGVGEGIKEVTCTVEKTPEVIIAALAKETGWNLSTKSITMDQPEKGCLTVAFTADSSIYTNPPDPQKEMYHVFDADDWVHIVLNSVAETLNKNFDIKGVAFSSPEGGDVEAGNEFLKFNFSSKALWNYESILQESKVTSKATELIRKTMETRGEKGAVIIKSGDETIGGEHCLTFSVGDNSTDGQKFTANYHYAVSDSEKIWTMDIMKGPDWILLGA